MKKVLAVAVSAMLFAAASQAQIKVGITVSATGPAASLGIPEKNTFDLVPRTIGGQNVTYIVLDDASDTTKAVTNAKKLIAEDKVDVIIGSTTTPTSLAIIDVVAEAETPMLSMAASAKIVDPANPKTKWVFKTPQNDSLMADAIVENMKANGVTTMGYIGFSDAYGESWLHEMRRAAAAAGIKIVADERYNRTDASTMGQVVKLMSLNPQAILVAGSGTPAATPHKELVARGYKGKIYQTHGVANNDWLRVMGKDAEGTLLPAGPMLVWEQLPDSNPVKKVAREYVTAYEAKFGPRSTFGGHAQDAFLLVNAAIPEALKAGKPGTKEFRAALRAALESGREVVGVNGVFKITPQDHNGMDARARQMLTVKDGKWLVVTK
ncbi:MAG: ABC transporter substrate-binding protein [Burkholderiales bacterium]|nr:ABC transporter substrate-binding protein [Burkholderiales bacterium]